MIEIEVTTHSGQNAELLQVESYDAKSTAEILNGITKNEIGNPYNVITLGNNIYSCLDIKSIRVIQKIEDDTEQSAE